MLTRGGGGDKGRVESRSLDAAGERLNGRRR
jgi:hypothetical protein